MLVSLYDIQHRYPWKEELVMTELMQNCFVFTHGTENTKMKRRNLTKYQNQIR